MSEISIPFALDHHGVEVPIEEATRGRIDYYTCPECGNILTPYKGSKQKHHYRHKKGVLQDDECDLSSISDVNQMVDDLRTSDVEKEEKNKNIRVYLGEEPGGRHRLFGVIPSADWDQIPVGVDPNDLLEQTSVSCEGVTHPPTARSFHPSEAEVTFELDPGFDEYEVTIEGPDRLENINGRWTTKGLEPGNVFVGDQTRARRANSKRKIKPNEWVYAVTDGNATPRSEEMSVHTLGDLEILSFPARENTSNTLSDLGLNLHTDEYGFDADVILPTDAHPTADKPISAAPGEPVLIAVTPAEELDPAFEIVSVPREKSDSVDELPQTGLGNPRFYKTTVPSQGSRRVSVHQRNSNRHRLVHLHAVEPQDENPLSESMYGELGLQVNIDGEEEFLSPIGDNRSYLFDGDKIASPAALPAHIDYIGPEGLEIEIEARFPPESSMNLVQRNTTDLESELANAGYWVSQGCIGLTIRFDGIGNVELSFSDQTHEVAQ